MAVFPVTLSIEVDVTADDAEDAHQTALEVASNGGYTPTFENEAAVSVGEPSTPDIDLNVPSYPAFVSAVVDGIAVTLANWRDYRGWEVRREVKHRTESAPTTLGYIAGIVDVNVNRKWAARTTNWRNLGETSRGDDAIRLLLGRDN